MVAIETLTFTIVFERLLTTLSMQSSHTLLQTIFFLLSWICAAQAQIIPDGTVGTQVQSSDNQTFTVTRGSSVGGNLFHSFDSFSIPDQGSVIFQADPTTHNIFSRVTGSTPSNLEGLLSVQGSNANFFLLNPNGIVFGLHASLNVGGSFLATTAESLVFSDGITFSARNLQSQPLLTIKPVGLQFGATPGDISSTAASLQVPTGKNLALVGGNISLEGGIVAAPQISIARSSPGGQIDLGSVGANNQVDLQLTGSNFVLGYDQVQQFQDITLSAGVFVSASGANGSGAIRLQGRRIELEGKAEVSALNFGQNLVGNITINASESLRLRSESRISTSPFSTGIAGDITINTPQLRVEGGSFISATTGQLGQRGGNVTINAIQQVEVTELSDITAGTFSTSSAGNLNITTSRLLLTNGGQIRSSTSASGDGGTININASDVKIRGSQFNFRQQEVPSGIVAVAKTESNIVAASGDAGRITVNADRLSITDGGQITVDATSSGIGAAGDLIINAGSIVLDEQGRITAATTGGRGNIFLNVENGLVLRHGSTITTNAQGVVGGGNIEINTSLLVGTEGSRIAADAQQGYGGQVVIRADGLFFSRNAQITASSELGPEFNGEVELIVKTALEGDLNRSSAILDPTKLLASICDPNKAGQFANTAQGGLMHSPADVFTSQTVLRDFRPLLPLPSLKQIGSGLSEKSTIEPIDRIPEAQGWVRDDQGQIRLVVESPHSLDTNSELTTVSCNGQPLS
jgi:filamentous hemagglutinin family protein